MASKSGLSPTWRGGHGAELYVKDPQGQIVTRLAQVEAQPAQSVYTTLMRDYQLKLEKSMGNNERGDCRAGTEYGTCTGDGVYAGLRSESV